MAKNKLMFPSLYLFLGDRAVSLWEYYRSRMPLDASSLLLTSEEAGGDEHALTYSIPVPHDADKKNIRRMIQDGFASDTEKIIALNLLIRSIKSNIQRKSHEQSYQLDKINVFVATYAHDPFNILLSDVSSLVKNILSEDFPVVSMTLFSLLEEGNDREDFGFMQAATIAYFRELERIQAQAVFKKPIKISRQGIVSDCIVNDGLFQISFLVSDRDERGRLSEESRVVAADILEAVETLKNTPNSPFNEYAFAVSGEDSKPIFASAGISLLNTPTEAIRATVVQHFYDCLLSRQKNSKGIDIDFDAICRNALSTEIQWQEDFCSIMQKSVTVSAISGISYREAEDIMFGSAFEDFFDNNCLKIAETQSRENQQRVGEKLSEIIPSAIEQNGIYALRGYSHTGFEQIRSRINTDILSINSELEQRYLQHTPASGIKDTIFKERYFKQVRAYLDDIYVLKYRKLRCEELLMLVASCEDWLEDYKSVVDARIRACEALDKKLLAKRDTLCDGHSSSIVYKNIIPYYKQATASIIKDLEKNGVMNEIELFGWAEDEDILYNNTIDFCKKHIFARNEFCMTFDEELQARSNVTVEEYGEDILYREDFFKQLSEMLDHSSAMCISLTKPCEEFYTEKFYIGSMESKFMKYLQNRSQHVKSRSTCVDIKKNDGLTQINVMSGFSLEQLRCYRACEENYIGYTNAGYDFGNG